MPVQLTMPRLSDTMEAGTIVRWNVKEGDTVSSGDVVADVETDKATMEMPVYDDGVISRIMVEAGKLVPVGTPIAIISVEGDAVDSAAGGAGLAEGTPASTRVSPTAASTAQTMASPQALPAAATRSEVASAQGESSSNREESRTRVSPLARRIA